MGDSYIVTLVFEVSATKTDPGRFARIARHFGEALPPGSLTREVHAPVDGMGKVTACVQTDVGPARALYAVATALELAASQEPAELYTLGSVRHITIDLQGS